MSALLALLFLAQNPAPHAPASGMGASMETVAKAFAACLRSGVMAAGPELTPEASADKVLAGCSADQSRIEQLVETGIASAPADQQAAARAHLRDGLAQARTKVADGIRQKRAATAKPK